MKYPSEYNKNILTLITLYFKYRKFHTYGYMKFDPYKEKYEEKITYKVIFD